MSAEPQILAFGNFLLDPSDQRLLGPSGPIHIGGRAFGVLRALLEARGRLVTKDELFDRVWGGLAVSDAALTSVIHELRIALGDQGTGGMIKAVYGKGYRLEVAGVGPAERTSPASPAAATPGSKDGLKLAVLAFDDLSPERNVGYFSDGISEEILSAIARGTQIRTIGKLSSFSFRGADKRRAPRELAVSHLIDGSVRREGGRVRITAHLYEAATGEMLWSESYDGALGSLLDTQVSIAGAIAAKLKQRFTEPPSAEILPDAYDLYLRAKSLEFVYGQQQTALAMLERVTREAPDFAPAWALIGSMLAFDRWVRPLVQWPLLVDQARQAIARARSIDPQEPLALSAEMRLTGPYGEFERQSDLLAAMAPVMGNTGAYHYLNAWHLGCTGRLGLAVVEARKSRELDPVAGTGNDLYGLFLYYAGHLEHAREVLLEDLEITPENQYVAASLILCAARLGDHSLVDRLLNPARLARYPLGELQGQGTIARVEVTGDAGLAAEVAASLQDRIRERRCFDLLSATYLARYRSPAACHDMIATLPIGPAGETASDFDSTSPIFVLLPDWPEIRRDRRFATLCARLGLAEFWTQRGIWPDCAEEEGLDYDFRDAISQAAATTSTDAPPRA